MVVKQLLGIMLTIIFLCLINSSGYSRVKNGLDLIPFQAKGVYGVKRKALNLIKINQRAARNLNKFQQYGVNVNNISRIYGGSLDGNFVGRRPNVVTVVEGRRFNRTLIYSKFQKKYFFKKAVYRGISYLKAANKDLYSIAVLSSQYIVFAKERHLKLSMSLFLGRGRSVSRGGIAGYYRAMRNANTLWAVIPMNRSIKKRIQTKLLKGRNYPHIMKARLISLRWDTNGKIDTITMNGFFSTNGQALSAKKEINERFRGIKVTAKGKTVSVKIVLNRMLTAFIIKSLRVK